MNNLFENFIFSVIGFYKISKNNIQIHVDGIAIKTNNKNIDKITKWCKDNLNGQRDELIRYDEFYTQDNWIRIWCN